MKIKCIAPDKPIFQIWATIDNSDTLEDCLVIQADDKDHANQIATQYYINNNDKFQIYRTTQIDLITEDK